MAPPVKVTEDWPITALAVPPQVVLAAPETNMPLGNVSIRGDVMVAAVLSGLLRVSVSVESPPAIIEGLLNNLLITGGELTVAAHEFTDTVFESRVTAPFSAIALPDEVVLVSSVTLVRAITVPMKLVPVPRVAELPTFQKTSHLCAPLMSDTEELLAVVRVLPIKKIKVASALPPALRVSVPVMAADDAKQ
jgi:hypothetical protein